MHWYNPKAREGEDVGSPTTDVEASEMRRGDLNSGAFMAEYERLRAGEGMEIEQAMILVGHEFRMRHLRYQPVGRSSATNSSAEGRRPRPLGAARAATRRQAQVTSCRSAWGCSPRGGNWPF